MMYSLYRREHYRTLSHRRLCHRGRADDTPLCGLPHTDSPALKNVQANVRFGSKADIVRLLGRYIRGVGVL